MPRRIRGGITVSFLLWAGLGSFGAAAGFARAEEAATIEDPGSPADPPADAAPDVPPDAPAPVPGAAPADAPKDAPADAPPGASADAPGDILPDRFPVALGALREPADEPAQEGVTVLDEVLVWGRAPRDLLADPSLESPGLETTRSTVDKTAIAQQNAFTVVDSLEYVPGAWIETRGRKVKQFFSIRGQQYPYPEYAVNGVWQREFYETPFLLSGAHFDRIEVLRSGGAMMLGPGSTVGFVNLVPRTFDEWEISLRAGYGFWNTTQFNVIHGDTVDGVSYALGVGHRSTDGPSSAHAAENLADFYGRVSGSPLDRLTLSLDLFGAYGSQELRRAEPPAGNQFQQDRSRYDPYRTILAVGKAELQEWESATLELNLSYAHRDHDFILASVADPVGREIDETDYELTTSILQALTIFEKNVLRVGGLYNRWIAPEGKRFYVGRRCDLETLSALIVDEQELGPVVLNAGYRWSRTYIDEYGAFGIDGSAAGFGDVVPIENEWDSPVNEATVGASVAVVDELSVHANFAFGQMAPRAGAQTADFERPDRETRYNFDLGLRAADPGIGQALVTGFYVIRDDAIELSGQTAEIDGDQVELYENRDEDQLGIELDVRSPRWEPGFQLFANAVLMKSYTKVDGDRERDREKPQAIVSSGVRFQKSRVDGAVYVKSLSGYESQRFVPAALGPQPLGDYVRLDANAGYSFGPKKQYRVFVAAENLTNEKYSTVAGYPDFGIRVMGGVDLRF